MTAIGERTTGDVGPGVTCPIFRMHPAIVAQASATLAAMYPGRHWLGPRHAARPSTSTSSPATGPRRPSGSPGCSRRSRSSSKLFGSPARTSSTTASTSSSSRPGCGRCPSQPPPIYIATAGPVTAKKTGQYAEGLITVGAPGDEARDDPREVRGGLPRRRQGPGRLQVHPPAPPARGRRPTRRRCANAMVEWPNGGMKFPKQDIRSPLDFEQMAKLVRPEDFEGRMLISADPEKHRGQIQKFLDLGFDQIYLHNVGREPGRAGSRSSAATSSRSSTRERRGRRGRDAFGAQLWSQASPGPPSATRRWPPRRPAGTASGRGTTCSRSRGRGSSRPSRAGPRSRRWPR